VADGRPGSPCRRDDSPREASAGEDSSTSLTARRCSGRRQVASSARTRRQHVVGRSASATRTGACRSRLPSAAPARWRHQHGRRRRATAPRVRTAGSGTSRLLELADIARRSTAPGACGGELGGETAPARARPPTMRARASRGGVPWTGVSLTGAIFILEQSRRATSEQGSAGGRRGRPPRRRGHRPRGRPCADRTQAVVDASLSPTSARPAGQGAHERREITLRQRQHADGHTEPPSAPRRAAESTHRRPGRRAPGTAPPSDADGRGGTFEPAMAVCMVRRSATGPRRARRRVARRFNVMRTRSTADLRAFGEDPFLVTRTASLTRAPVRRASTRRSALRATTRKARTQRRRDRRRHVPLGFASRAAGTGRTRSSTSAPCASLTSPVERGQGGAHRSIMCSYNRLKASGRAQPAAC